ncbi:DNA-binding transcriptional LysR family regulator [Variovorax boronicumulans]|uniref:DNA-binding transcriptional LysR family regulator n=1 Tax=Variovorax boronicumulans TaxID=436515 RepID=A0A250DP02_9BURK|nr:LysR family transcriptional regulator [Variovorax boronicumulans]ATA55719.1 LysR family transcriptional regulator [Variovorax boronicumulans]MDP9875742.1 DNA-binding transcriptional LysR family regulator [Variovorax boronicumulans]MDP9921024.1 DNA-binding transcriptional LysR family regulator [Variovorax boronicumulans]PBI88131.1 HTH-type transcriptional regulator DmlR [Variovorax boronicumulans]
MDQFAAMKAFRAVVEAGGFTAAADAMDVSHTVVSRHVKQLETALGVQLLNRTTRRFALTQAGQTYYEHARQILDQVETAALVVAQHQVEPTGLLRINAPMSFGLEELAQWLPAFLDAHPQVKADLVCNDRFVDLIEEGFDVGLRLAYALSDSTLIVKRLASFEEWWVASPAYLQRRGTPRTPADLAAHDCLNYSLAAKAAQPSFTAPDGSVCTVDVGGRLQANSGLVLRSAALAGTGLAASPAFLVRDPVARGELVRVLPEFRQQPLNLYALYPQNRHLSPKVRAFVDFAAARYLPADGQGD